MDFFLFLFVLAFAIALVPFGVCIFYFALAVRQLLLANRAGNAERKKGAWQIIALTTAGMLLIMMYWYWLMPDS